MNGNFIVPPPPSSQIETGAGGVQTQITEKNSDKGVFLLFFLQLYFFYWLNIYRGVGCNFLYFLLGGGGCKSLFLYKPI